MSDIPHSGFCAHTTQTFFWTLGSYFQCKINYYSLFYAPNVHWAIYHSKEFSNTMIKYLIIIALLYSRRVFKTNTFLFCFHLQQLK